MQQSISLSPIKGLLILRKGEKLGTFYSNFRRLFFYIPPRIKWLLTGTSSIERLPAIHSTYQKIALQLNIQSSAKLLKTDAWNEIETEFPISSLFSNVTSIEINSDRVLAMQKKYPTVNTVIGNVSSLPFPSASFDAILEFSTIDHVVDYKTVLQEYARVLGDNGILSLVVWLTAGRQQIQEWGGEEMVQLFYNDCAFRKALCENFEILHEGYFLKCGGWKYLAWFLLRKTP